MVRGRVTMAFMTRSRLSRWLLFYLAMLLADAAVIVAVVARV